MKQIRFVHYGSILLLSAFTLWGCPKNTEVSSAPETVKSAATPTQGQNEEMKGTAATGTEANTGAKETASTAAAGLQPVLFDFNASVLRDDARRILKEDAAWLKAHPQAAIRIEGNCDERGTKEYNLALGQRRAAAAKKFLAGLGIPAKRMSLISYGKEKPVCTAGDEACWQKNRRDDLVAVKD